MEEVHTKLGFENFSEWVSKPFNDDGEGIYIMSIDRISNTDISEFSDEQLMEELSSRGVEGKELDEFSDNLNNEWGEQ